MATGGSGDNAIVGSDGRRTVAGLGLLVISPSETQPNTPSARITECVQFMTQVQGEFLNLEQSLREKEEAFRKKVEMKEGELATEKEVHEERVQKEKVNLGRERRDFEEMKRRGIYAADSERQHVITLDVGGEKFRTDVRTLARHPDSIFPRLAGNIDPRSPRSDVFIDRDSKHFRFILNYMRQGEEVFRGTALRGKDGHDLEEMICEARYYGLKSFMKYLERHKIRLEEKTGRKPPLNFTQLVHEKYFLPPNPRVLYCAYVTTKQLLFKGRNMTNIVFDSVYFKHAVSFEGSLLNGAKFKQCRFDAVVDFTDADISNISFDHCVNLTPDRIIMNGDLAGKFGVTVNPHVDLSEFSIKYNA